MEPKEEKSIMKNRIVLRTISNYITPFIIMFGCYIQLHGDYSPGGGFQAGVICASAFILYGIISGLDSLEKVLSINVIKILCCFGPLLYGGVGIVSMIMGGEFLNYSALDANNPKHGQHIGIVIIELGVGITVFAVTMIIFTVFASRNKEDY